MDVDALRRELAESVGGEVRFDRLSRGLYSTDASVYQIVPLGVVLPRSEADVVATVRICARHGVPLTARGGGTSQAGQCIGPGVVLDCSKYFHQVIEINAAERWARVRPGCVLDELNRALKPFKLLFAPDISTSDRATVGGMVANNSSGTHSILHGKTIDHVLEVRAILADGSVITARPLQTDEVEEKCRQSDREGDCYRLLRRLAREHATEIDRRYPKILRRVGGYNLDRFVDCRAADRPFNLAGLLVGSEGTLAVTLEAKLRLVEAPRAKGLLVIEFAALLDALAATPSILRHGPAAVEVIDKYVLDATRLTPEANRLRGFLHGDPAAILIVEFYGNDANEPRDCVERLEAELRRGSIGTHWTRALDDVEQGRVWKLRRLSLGLSMAEKGDAKAISFVEDTAVAPDRLRDYIAELLAILRRYETTAGVYAHASVGCLHVRPVIDLKTLQGVARFEAIAAEVADLVARYGGALSGEHGDGLVRSPFQEKMFGPVLYEAFRTIKRTFDPQGILNPGKIVDAPPLATNFRFGPGYITPDVPTTFDFTAEGGIARAAELCAGVGECRKRRTGTLCPSYQATREELHSTRGRANTLRLALTGQLGLGGLTDPALAEAFDLCLECKACKSECPTGVDMARLKAEFLDQFHRKYGTPLRSRFFGHVAAVSRWGSRLAPLSSWLARSAPARWLNERLLGIDSRRKPPPFSRRTLLHRFIPQQGDGSASPRVLLFADTFTNYYQPEVGLAAVDLLRRAGCSVRLSESDTARSPLPCCGRPLISNGLLADAVRHSRENVLRLHPWAAAGGWITACEPSCLLTIQDDYPALLRGTEQEQARKVASACLTFEELLEKSLVDRRATLPFGPGPRQIIVQGHCHQKALVGTAAMVRLLQRIPGASVVDVDAGCCGMAGSFGYEKEHYEVSRLVGEQRLFPIVRRLAAEDVVVAPGFSCQMQIDHFTRRPAIHPALLMHRFLIDSWHSVR
jgi:FAD/FMN-containing dehydrogenase/Fe-S oxidoreductase